jgi:hypothetical protein
MSVESRPSLRPVPVSRKRRWLPGRDENNLVHSERFQVYKLPIWAVKTKIVGIDLACGLQHRIECCLVKESGEMP